jgi:hypothetical protein
VLASPLNGQFYVIGNPSDVLGGMGQRTIAPRAGPFSLDQSSVQNPKEDRQGWGYTQNTVEHFKTFEFKISELGEQLIMRLREDDVTISTTGL